MIEYPTGFDASYSRKPICGVLAVAICAGVSYGEAHAACKVHLPKHRKRFGGRTYFEQRIRALFMLNAKFIVWQHVPSSNLGDLPLLLERDVTYIVDVSGHTMTVRNGLVVDQYNRIRSGAHPSAHKRIKRIIEMV